MTLQVIRLFGYDSVTESINRIINLKLTIMEKMIFSNDQISAVVNAFIKFTMNFEYKWYEKCFDGWEIEHFGSKWEMWADRYSPECAFLHLWCALDDLHRAKLIAYIMREQHEMYEISCLNK